MSSLELICGSAGCGKTHEMRRRIAANPRYGVLAATTGIAAINLGACTINSLLGYFDTESLKDAYAENKLVPRMMELARSYRYIIIDEVGMMDGRQLDILRKAAKQADIGIILVGDFCQLPPVNSPWAFTAQCWSEFAESVTRLTKNWRQDNGVFLEALGHLRAGKGKEAAALLPDSVFEKDLDRTFDGTTIFGTNKEVNDYNEYRYRQIDEPERDFLSRRWGRGSGGWEQIPESLSLKVGALVMVLANDTEKSIDGPLMRWVNGDCGHVTYMNHNSVEVELFRTNKRITLGMLERRTESKFPNDKYKEWQIKEALEWGTKLPDGSFWDKDKERWVRGAIRYMPLRLAWATTCHKSQGLSLDKVQIDLRGNFIGSPSMVYVSVSRCRTLEGLHLVGNREMLEKKTKVSKEVLAWL